MLIFGLLALLWNAVYALTIDESENGFRLIPATNIYSPPDLFDVKDDSLSRDLFPVKATSFSDSICQKNVSYLYRYTSASIFNPSGIQPDSSNANASISGNVILSCLQTTKVQGLNVHIYDIKLENFIASIQKKTYKINDNHLSNPFRFVRDISAGKVLGIYPAFLEPLDARFIKIAVAEAFNSQFEYKDNLRTVAAVDHGITGSRNTNYTASMAGDLAVVRSFWTHKDMITWHPQSDFDSRIFTLYSRSHATFNITTGHLLQSFDRSNIGFDQREASLLNFKFSSDEGGGGLDTNGPTYFALSSDIVLTSIIDWSPNPASLPENLDQSLISIHGLEFKNATKNKAIFPFNMLHSSSSISSQSQLGRRHGRAPIKQTWLHRDNQWNSTNSTSYDLIEPLKQRENDLKMYPESKALLYSDRLGKGFLRIDIAGGAFAGLTENLCNVPSFKTFSHASANGTLFGLAFELLSAQVSAEHNAVDNSFKTVVNVKLWGNKQIDSDHVVDCKEWKMPLLQEFLHHDILDFGFDIPIFMSIASFRLIVQGLYEPMMNVKFCAEPSAFASIMNRLDVQGKGIAGIGWDYLGFSMNATGSMGVQFGPEASVQTNPYCSACVSTGLGRDDFKFTADVALNAFGWQHKVRIADFVLPGAPYGKVKEKCGNSIGFWDRFGNVTWRDWSDDADWMDFN